MIFLVSLVTFSNMTRSYRCAPVLLLFLALTASLAVAIPHTSGASQIQLIDSFLQWLTDKKVTMKSVEIAYDGGVKGGLGLRATSDLSAQEVFASIPLVALISIEHVFLDEVNNRQLCSEQEEGGGCIRICTDN